MPATHPEQDRALAEWAASCALDPLKFVREGYPWREPGPLEGYDGPDVWQTELLTEIGRQVTERAFDGQTAVLPIRIAVSSGHGIGKSTLVAWLVNWIMSTRPHCKGSITANTFTQLETKTWAAVQTWTKRCITGGWFVVPTTKMYHPAYRESWFCAPLSSDEHNSEAFAGQQAADSTSFYIVDEASAVPDVIFDVAEGGLAKGEPMIFLFGNPTRHSGKFYEACFGKGRDRWTTRTIDASTCSFANQALIQEWREDYGDDSDFFRVRVQGLPPSASDAQFIDSTRIFGAQRRLADALADEPLVAGVDVSGGGSAWTVCRYRRGLDARSHAPIRITGEQTRDRNKVIAILAEALSQRDPAHKISAMFIDSAFGSPIVERLQLLGYRQVYEVNFGGASPDLHDANQRAYQWRRMKDWLLRGSISSDDQRLVSDLTGPGFHLNRKDQLVLESKESMLKRGVASPDDGDALSLTFAQPVAWLRPDEDDEGSYRPRSTWG